MKKILSFFLLFAFSSAYAQNYTGAPAHDESPPEKDDTEDSSRIIGHVYHVNAWGSLGITAAATVASIAAIAPIRSKPDITDAEFDAVQSPTSRTTINSFDKWALNLSLPTTNFTWYAVGVQAVCAGLPLTLFLGDRFKKNWDDIFLMMLEVNAITVAVYQISPFGPLFQTKFRPIVYYATTAAERDSIKSGNNRNSFYSGHVASATASMYLMAKVYCDYHPEIQGWDKIGIYGLATIPPTILAYLRLTALKHFPSDILVGYLIGGVCGIAIPEIHRIAGKAVSFGAYSSPTSSGLSLTYNLK